MTRLYARSGAGERISDHIPDARWQATTILSSLRLDGTTNAMVFEDALNGDLFRAWVENCLSPTLRPGDIVIMDNLSSHKVSGIEELISSCGAKVEYLPPYSPDLNPVENMWSKIKSFLRKVKKRDKESLFEAVGDALSSVSSQDAAGWFQFCGYCSCF